MNILVIAHFQNDGSPTAIFIHDQIQELQALGHHVRVISPLAIGKPRVNGKHFETIVIKNIIDDVDIYYVRYLTLSQFGVTFFNPISCFCSILSRWNVILHDFTPDIIHAHTIMFDGSIATRIGAKIGVPVVITTHGSDTIIPILRGKQTQLKNVCDLANHIICVSSSLREKLLAIGVNTDVSVIHNGFVLGNLCNANKVPYSLLQVGSLIERKKTDVTVRAFAQIRAQYPSATLTIVGKGEERLALVALCRELCISDDVQFLGGVSNADVLSEMGKAQFFVMPSVREGFGIVYLEAMASGCIAIGTQDEGIADLIISGDNGILVSPNDPSAIVKAVVQCIENPAAAATIVDRGKRDATDMTWTKNALQYIGLFKTLILKRSDEGVQNVGAR